MPITEPVWVISETPARAMPKSVTVALPSASTITFCGFRSRWTMPLRWAKRGRLEDLADQADRLLGA